MKWGLRSITWGPGDSTGQGGRDRGRRTSSWCRNGSESLTISPKTTSGCTGRSARRFMAGEYLYQIGHTPYPPFWGMVCAPLSLLPKRWSHVAAYPDRRCFVGGARPPAPSPDAPVASAGHGSPCSGRQHWHWPCRAGSSSANCRNAARICSWSHWPGEPRVLEDAAATGSQALCLGLAIAMKCTQALFVPYFILKRQWRMVAATTVFTLLFSVAPVVRQGPALYERHLTAWAGNCWKGLRTADPSVGVLGQEEVWNVSLKPTLARYLMHLPPGHKGRIASSWRAEWLDLSPPVAGVVIKAGMLVLAGLRCLAIPSAGPRSRSRR